MPLSQAKKWVLLVSKCVYEGTEMHWGVIDAAVQHSAVFGDQIHVVKHEAVDIGSHVSNHGEAHVVQFA